MGLRIILWLLLISLHVATISVRVIASVGVDNQALQVTLSNSSVVDATSAMRGLLRSAGGANCSTRNTLIHTCPRKDRSLVPRAIHSVGRITFGSIKCGGVVLGKMKEATYVLTAAQCIPPDLKISHGSIDMFVCKETVTYPLDSVFSINRNLNYAIVTIKISGVDFAETHDSMMLRETGPALGEVVLVPQLTTNSVILAMGPTNGQIDVRPSEMISYCPTDRAKSRFNYELTGMMSEFIGMPVISISDGKIVGMHVCGQCDAGVVNSALSVKSVIVDLKSKAIMFDFAA